MVAIIPWTSFCQHQAQLRHVSEDGGGNGGGGDGGGGGGGDVNDTIDDETQNSKV